MGDFILVTSAITNWSKIRRTGEHHGALEREVAHRTLVDTHWHMEAKETEIRTLAPTNSQFQHTFSQRNHCSFKLQRIQRPTVWPD